MHDQTSASGVGSGRVVLALILAVALASCASTAPRGDVEQSSWQQAHAQAMAEYEAGDYPQAAEYARHAHTAVVGELGADTAEAAGVLSMLAAAELANGRFVEAAQGFEESLRILRALETPRPDNVADALNNLGELYRQQGDFERALPYLEKAHATSEAAFGPASIEATHSLAALALIRHERGDLDTARHDYATALERMHAAGAHPVDRARVLANQADLLARVGEPEAARAALGEVLAIEEKHLPRGHPDLAYTLNSLGVVADAQGRHEDALGFYERAFAIRTAALPPEHPGIARVLGNMAGTHADLGNISEARARYLEAIRVLRSALGGDHPDVAEYEAALRGLSG